MKRVTLLMCLCALVCGSALCAGMPVDQGPLMATLHATASVIKKSGPERARLEPDAEAAIRNFWQEALAYTRTHSGAELDNVRWVIPFRTAHEWMLTYVCRNRAQAEALTREALAALRASKPQSLALAAELAGDLALTYAYAWMKSDVAGCAQLVDETGVWVAASGDKPAMQAFFVKRMFFEGNCLLCQFQLPEAERKEFCAKRGLRLTQYLDDDNLRLRYRTLAVSHWADCLLSLGRNNDAYTYLTDWWQKHPNKIVEALYYQVLMKVALSAKGDWVLARRVLDTTNKLSGQWERSYEAKINESIGELYYGSIQFPGYELKRAGALKQRKTEQTLRSLAGASAANR